MHQQPLQEARILDIRICDLNLCTHTHTKCNVHAVNPDGREIEYTGQNVIRRSRWAACVCKGNDLLICYARVERGRTLVPPLFKIPKLYNRPFFIKRSTFLQNNYPLASATCVPIVHPQRAEGVYYYYYTPQRRILLLGL